MEIVGSTFCDENRYSFIFERHSCGGGLSSKYIFSLHVQPTITEKFVQAAKWNGINSGFVSEWGRV